MRKLAGIFVLFACPALAQTAEIGIDRSNLTRESMAVQEKTLQDIHALHATWFRDVLSAGTPQNMTAFVNEVKLAKQNGVEYLANVLPSGADYDNMKTPAKTFANAAVGRKARRKSAKSTLPNSRSACELSWTKSKRPI